MAVTSYPPTNGLDGIAPGAVGKTASEIQTVTKLANIDEERFAKTLKTMQKIATDKRTGKSLKRVLSNLLIVPFLAFPLSLIWIGGITYFLQFYFENNKPLDKSCMI